MNYMDSVWDEDPCCNGYQPKEETAPGGSNPAQYALPAGAQELQDLIEYREMNFAVGNIFKAAYRLGHCDHGDELRDLRKIIWFANRELKRLEALVSDGGGGSVSPDMNNQSHQRGHLRRVRESVEWSG